MEKCILKLKHKMLDFSAVMRFRNREAFPFMRSTDSGWKR